MYSRVVWIMDVLQDYLDNGCTPGLSGLWMYSRIIWIDGYTPGLSGLMVILQDYLVYSWTPGLSGLDLYSRIFWFWIMVLLRTRRLSIQVWIWESTHEWVRTHHLLCAHPSRELGVPVPKLVHVDGYHTRVVVKLNKPLEKDNSLKH